MAILTNNGEHGKNSDLTKNRQKFNENSNYLSNGAPMKSVDFDENGENGENSDLIKNCQRLNKNSN